MAQLPFVLGFGRLFGPETPVFPPLVSEKFMRLLNVSWRGLGLFALVLGLLGPLSVSAQSGSSDENLLTIGAIICDVEESTAPGTAPLPCEPFSDTLVTVTADADGSITGECTLDLVASGSQSLCAVRVPFEASYTVSLDEAAVPDGHRLAENGIPVDVGTIPTGGGDGPAITFRLYLIDRAAGSAPTTESPAAQATTEPTAVPGSAGTGSPAAIYAGDCDADFSADPVAVLSEVTTPDGDVQGAAITETVETSFTTLDLPIDDILAENHVLVVFDEDDDTVPIACGTIGGIVTDNGALAFGLPAIGDSLVSGVAYLTGDGDQTDATIFLAENLSGAGAPSGA